MLRIRDSLIVAVLLLLRKGDCVLKFEVIASAGGVTDEEVLDFSKEKIIGDQKGTYGEVWQAFYLSKYPVAIKVARSVDYEDSIKQEWNAYFDVKAVIAPEQTEVSDAEKAGIPRVYFIGRVSGMLALVMELMGENLEKYSETHELCTMELMRISFEISAAIKYVHEMGYIHRDVKPDNFMFALVESSENGIRTTKVYLADFGFALKVENWTEPLGGAICGTLPYLSLNGHKMMFEDPPVTMPKQEDDIESATYAIYMIKKRTLAWIALTNQFHTFDAMSDAMVKSHGMKPAQRERQANWCLAQIQKKKQAFENDIRANLFYSNGRLSIGGEILLRMLNYARNNIVQNQVADTEDTLLKAWEVGYARHRSSALKAIEASKAIQKNFSSLKSGSEISATNAQNQALSESSKVVLTTGETVPLTTSSDAPPPISLEVADAIVKGDDQENQQLLKKKIKRRGCLFGF